MAKPLLDDELWNLIEPLLPPDPPRRHRYPGRKRVPNRACLVGILFVLRTGIPWEYLPAEMNCGSGMTCWRRLRDWNKAGVWSRLHQVLLGHLRGADQIDWSRAVIDSGSVRAVGGGGKTGPNPTDRAKPGSKHHVLTDASGIPLATAVTGANAADVTQLEPLLDAVPAVGGKRGAKKRKPRAVYADRAYDSDRHRKRVKARHIEPHLARRGAPHGSGLGKMRWVVERTIAFLRQFRRLRVRFERRADIHEALLQLGTSLVTYNYYRRLQTFC